MPSLRERPRTDPRLDHRLPWRVVVVSAYPRCLARGLAQFEDAVVFRDGTRGLAPAFLEAQEPDVLLVFGYDRIIRRDVLDRVCCVNLHLSPLSYDRGHNPDLWSLIRGTQRSVTLHFVDEGVNTGAIVAQRELDMPAGSKTHRFSLSRLFDDAGSFFVDAWSSFRPGSDRSRPQSGEGAHSARKGLLPVDHLFGHLDVMTLGGFRTEASRRLGTDIGR